MRTGLWSTIMLSLAQIHPWPLKMDLTQLAYLLRRFSVYVLRIHRLLIGHRLLMQTHKIMAACIHRLI